MLPMKEEGMYFLTLPLYLQPEDTEIHISSPKFLICTLLLTSVSPGELERTHLLISDHCGLRGFVPAWNVLFHRDRSALWRPCEYSSVSARLSSLPQHNQHLGDQISHACIPSGFGESHILEIAIAADENQS